MTLRIKNITIRIEELDFEINKLEQKLSAMHWERKKYQQFSNNQKNQSDPPSIK